MFRVTIYCNYHDPAPPLSLSYVRKRWGAGLFVLKLIIVTIYCKTTFEVQRLDCIFYIELFFPEISKVKNYTIFVVVVVVISILRAEKG